MKFDLRKLSLFVIIFTLLFVSVKNNVFAGACTAESGNCYVPAGVGVDASGQICTNDHWTTCATDYVCSISNSGPGNTGACVKPGTNPGTCDWVQSNCPPGTSPDYNQLISSYCGKITYCPGPGTAQTKGDCGNCRWIPDCYTDPKTGKETCKDDIWACTNQLINTYKCVVPPTIPPTIAPTPIPTASCSMNKIYTNNWVELTPTAFKGLTAGVQVYFCVNGVTNTNIFDAGRFTINGVSRLKTTLKRPGTNDFCDLYTIPANTYSFKVQGEMHHVLLGWL
jgi:hypothetical protein